MNGPPQCPRCNGVIRTHHVEYATCYQCGWADYTKKLMRLPSRQDVEGLGNLTYKGDSSRSHKYDRP